MNKKCSICGRDGAEKHWININMQNRYEHMIICSICKAEQEAPPEEMPSYGADDGDE